MSDDGPLARALAALRDADRFLYVCRTTYEREREEARDERQQRQVLGGAGVVIDMVRSAARRDGDGDGDAIVAVQEVGEAVRLVRQALALLPEGSDARESLDAALAHDRQRARELPFLDRVHALQQAVRWHFERLRSGDPALAAAVSPLPTWDVTDDEDRQLARAAGAGLSRDKIAVGVIAVLLLLYFQLMGD